MSRSKRTRLTDSTEFDRVYKQGVAFRGKLFSVHAFPNDLDTPRLGLSVSRKVGNAVTRNTVRRRLKEVFASMIDEVPGSMDLVVSARPGAAGASFEELGDEFGRSLRKIAEKGAGRKA